VIRAADGSASLKCRYVNHDGESCSESRIWESLGLQPPRWERDSDVSVQPDREDEPRAEPCPTENGSLDPVDDPAATEPPAAEVSLEATAIAAAAPEHPVRAGAGEGGRSGYRNGSLGRMFAEFAREIRFLRGHDQRLYAQIPVDGRQEVHELKSPSFRHRLAASCRQRYSVLLTRDAINNLVRAFEAEAATFGSSARVWVRVADGTGTAPAQAAAQAEPGDGAGDVVLGDSVPNAGTAIYLDLGDSSRRSVEIRADGCRIVDQAPVLFRRPRGHCPLPEPEWDGSIERLKKYANVTDGDFPLLIAWMTAALRPAGPFPILILTGEQGSAKSTLARMARRLIDPNSSPLRGPPGKQDDFMIQAHNTWVLAYDNMRSIPARLSDAFCRTATGGGFSTRALYSNDDETLIDVERPAIITGIDEFARSSDLIDRCIILQLPPIPGTARRPEQALWSDFDADCPRLLGALLKAVAGGLKMLPDIELPALPRMADFAQWGEAVVRGLGGEPGSFLERYDENRRAACESALGDCPVADALRRMVERLDGPCQLTATELLRTLANDTPPSITRMKEWPKTARSLSCALRRIAPQLRMVGITLSFGCTGSTRPITISPR